MKKNNMTTQEQINEAIKAWEFLHLEELMKQKVGPQSSEYFGQLELPFMKVPTKQEMKEMADTFLEMFKETEESEQEMFIPTEQEMRDLVRRKLEEAEEEAEEETEMTVFTGNSTPHKCPVCDGRGVVPLGFYQIYGNYSTTDGRHDEPCRSCANGIIYT